MLLFCLYAGVYVYRTSFVVDGTRYFSLFDDAMVSMRYARNLAQGHGLVWNPGGERVEGYTNPLWVLFMALLHLLPVAPSKISLLVQACAVLFLVANLFVVERIAGLIADRAPLATLGAAFLTAFYLPLNTWSLQGMEVSILALLVSLAVWQAARGLRSGKASPWPYALLGLSTLVRPDMVAPALAILLFLALADPAHRRRHLLLGLGTFSLFLAGQTLLRLWYYGDVLPNTYYLKMTGYPILLRVSRGIYVTAVFAWPLAWMIGLVALGGALLRDRAVWLPFWVFLVQVAYSAFVGGDAWEWWGGANRYVAIAMPVFLASFTGVAARLGRLLLDRSSHPRRLRCAGCALVALALLSFTNPTVGSPQCTSEYLQQRPPLHLTGNRDTVIIAHLVRTITREQATVAVVWAGSIPYHADRCAVDLLGKNDPVIARAPMRIPSGPQRPIGFYPGHLKWDYAYSIGRLKPDLVVQLWQAPEEAQPFLERDYVKVNLRGFDFYLRKDSGNILWPRVGAQGGRTPAGRHAL